MTIFVVPAAKVVGAAVIATPRPEPEPHPAMLRAQDATTRVQRVSLFIMPAFVSEIDCHLVDVFLEIEVTKAARMYTRLIDGFAFAMAKKDSRVD
jgi:hypothetical protein